MRCLAKVLIALCIGLVLVFALSRYSESTLANHPECVECHNEASGFTQGYFDDSTHHAYHFHGSYPCGDPRCHPMATPWPPRSTCVGWQYDVGWEPCHTADVE